jgi:cobalt-zinc-cadmium efflux system outer membrane protein
LTLLVWSENGLAQSTLTEEKVIELSRSSAPASSVARAYEELAEARRRVAGPLLNPSVAWSREGLSGSASGTEDVVSATIPFDIARPVAARSLASTEAAWAKVESSLAQAEITEAALVAYVEVVVASHELDILKEALQNLKEAGRVLSHREEAGSASGYERIRLALETELSRSRLSEAQGKLTSARARLSGMLGLPGALPPIEMELSLMNEREEALLVGSQAKEAPALGRAKVAHRLAGDAQKDAEWTWIPALELTGGMKHVSDFGGAFGYVFGLSFQVPIFDRAQSFRAESSAQARLVQTRKRSLEARLKTDVESAHASYLSSKQELERFERETGGLVGDLLLAAKSGYLEGERSIVELLDAQRAQTDVAERRLLLLSAAKRAESRLRAATGEFQ